MRHFEAIHSAAVEHFAWPRLNGSLGWWHTHAPLFKAILARVNSGCSRELAALLKKCANNGTAAAAEEEKMARTSKKKKSEITTQPL